MSGNDKIYSRRRIKLPDVMRIIREVKSFKIILIIFFITILISLWSFMNMAYPVFRASCETAAASKGNKIINDEVNKVMEEYSYNSLIKIEKDTNGKISFIEADSGKINDIVSKIISNIQKEFDKIPRINVFINMGSVSGISVLKNWEPKFEIELESAGTLNANVKTEFDSVGINQTHHKVFLEINGKIGILTPFDTFENKVHTDVILTEAIIVGEVPSAYYDLDGVQDLETLKNTYNFVD